MKLNGKTFFWKDQKITYKQNKSIYKGWCFCEFRVNNKPVKKFLFEKKDVKKNHLVKTLKKNTEKLISKPLWFYEKFAADVTLKDYKVLMKALKYRKAGKEVK